MSESAGRVVAWLDKDEHGECAHVPSQTDGTFDPKWTPLVPEQLLVEAEHERDRWDANAEQWKLLAIERGKQLEAVLALADELECDSRDNPDAYQLIAQKIRALTEKSEETR